MRPVILYNLFSPINILDGIGDAKYKFLKKIGCYHIKDLYYYIPYDYINRDNTGPLDTVNDNSIVTKKCKVLGHLVPSYSKSPYKIDCITDMNEELQVIYFKSYKSHLVKLFPINQEVVLSGKVEKITSSLYQMSHPDFVLSIPQWNSMNKMQSIYHATQYMSSNFIATTIQKALRYLPDLPEWIDSALLQEKEWISWRDSIYSLHFAPEDILERRRKYIERLAYDEIFAQQLHLQFLRNKILSRQEKRVDIDYSLSLQLRNIIPFTLTEAQEQVVSQITADQQSDNKMMRFIQGDVGSGKTIVSLFAIINSISRGKKAALMVPTEILAIQHYNNILRYCEQLSIKVEILISKMRPSVKKDIISMLSDDEPMLIIGTHALFQDAVEFNNLELVVIDEQHKFGVNQRISLLNKGRDIDLLMMSATPIPRSLSMIQYGDFDLSVIKDKPKERLEIQTILIEDTRINELKESIMRSVERGEKVFWICPLITESEKVDLANVQKRYEDLCASNIGAVGVIHGRMLPDEREEVMEGFIRGDYNILIATTVIEVGVDVRDATVMVIENPDRFGLSQLHQIRGRIGRGDKQSYCILLYPKDIGYIGKKRLSIMKNYNDGFKISEEDLKMRGSGDITGQKQSGVPDFKIFNLYNHMHLVPLAHSNACNVLRLLESGEHMDAIDNLLQLFKKSEFSNQQYS